MRYNYINAYNDFHLQIYKISFYFIKKYNSKRILQFIILINIKKEAILHPKKACNDHISIMLLISQFNMLFYI